MKSIIIPNGIMHLAESKAICPKCKRQIPFEEIEEKFMKQDKHYIKMKCKCKRYVGITQDIKGDFRAYEL
jgi:hypothetical protein